MALRVDSLPRPSTTTLAIWVLAATTSLANRNTPCLCSVCSSCSSSSWASGPILGGVTSCEIRSAITSSSVGLLGGFNLDPPVRGGPAIAVVVGRQGRSAALVENLKLDGGFLIRWCLHIRIVVLASQQVNPLLAKMNRHEQRITADTVGNDHRKLDAASARGDSHPGALLNSALSGELGTDLNETMRELLLDAGTTSGLIGALKMLA